VVVCIDLVSWVWMRSRCKVLGAQQAVVQVFASFPLRLDVGTSRPRPVYFLWFPEKTPGEGLTSEARSRQGSSRWMLCRSSVVLPRCTRRRSLDLRTAQGTANPLFGGCCLCCSVGNSISWKWQFLEEQLLEAAAGGIGSAAASFPGRMGSCLTDTG